VEKWWRSWKEVYFVQEVSHFCLLFLLSMKEHVSHHHSDHCVGSNDDNCSVIIPHLTDGTIHGAVALWCCNRRLARRIYGPIEEWDVSQVTNMLGLFEGWPNFNANIGRWDVSQVVDLSRIFRWASDFNQSVENWNVCNVRTMKQAFDRAEAFNQPLSRWDISNVMDMSYMFAGARAFNQSLSTWNVTTKINVAFMFSHATAFNQSLTTWCISKDTLSTHMFEAAPLFHMSNAPRVAFPQDQIHFESTAIPRCHPSFTVDNDRVRVTSTTTLRTDDVDVSSFAHCSGYLLSLPVLLQGLYHRLPLDLCREIRAMLWQPLTDDTIQDAVQKLDEVDVFHRHGLIELWDVRQVTAMDRLFYDHHEFNGDISRWDVSHVTSMSEMFGWASSFNVPIGGWDVSRVTNMRGMFQWGGAFNQPLNEWNVARVRCMRCMFHGCRRFNQPLCAWDVSAVEDMSELFSGCVVFNQPLARWDVSRVIDMREMFNHALVFNQNVSAWNVGHVRNITRMFYSAMQQRYQWMMDWEMSQVQAMAQMFGDDTAGFYEGLTKCRPHVLTMVM
jgi:surface protein